MFLSSDGYVSCGVHNAMKVWYQMVPTMGCYKLSLLNNAMKVKWNACIWLNIYRLHHVTVPCIFRRNFCWECCYTSIFLKLNRADSVEEKVPHVSLRGFDALEVYCHMCRVLFTDIVSFSLLHFSVYFLPCLVFLCLVILSLACVVPLCNC